MRRRLRRPLLNPLLVDRRGLLPRAERRRFFSVRRLEPVSFPACLRRRVRVRRALRSRTTLPPRENLYPAGSWRPLRFIRRCAFFRRWDGDFFDFFVRLSKEPRTKWTLPLFERRVYGRRYDTSASYAFADLFEGPNDLDLLDPEATTASLDLLADVIGTPRARSPVATMDRAPPVADLLGRLEEFQRDGLGNDGGCLDLIENGRSRDYGVEEH